MMNFSHLLASSNKILMLIPKYYEQWDDRIEDYVNVINEDMIWCINRGEFSLTMLVTVLLLQVKIWSLKEIKWRRMIRNVFVNYMLLPTIYNYVWSCKTAKEIWDTLKEKYHGNEKTKKIFVKQCLLELSEFKQKKNESIESYYNRLNELIFKSSRYGVTCSSLEFNITFLMGLRK